jgi:cytochrome c-type biogenesis protein CcmE
MAKRKAKSTQWFIGIALIGAAITAIAVTQLKSNIVYFYTPDEVVAQAATLQQKTIKLGGMVQPGSVKWTAEQLSLEFVVTDLKGHDIAVHHKGTPPDLFKEGQGVVIEGQVEPDGKNMKSTKLMVKHSEEYKKPSGSHATDSMNKELLEKSLFKGSSTP